MTRAVKRAGIPLWYTEGFNPHPYMTFPLPLSLGVESDRECMDIKVEDGVSLGEIKKSFDGKMPEGLDVFDVTVPFNDAKEIRSAAYRITAKFKDEKSACDYVSLAQNAIEAKTLVGRKKGKQGRKKVMKEIPLAEHIFECDFSVNKDEVEINVRLSAGNENNINPSVFVGALNENSGTIPEYVLFFKKALYTQGTEIFY